MSEDLTNDREEMAVEPNDPNAEGVDELRIVVGDDGSACATRAVEFAVKEAARWGALLHVVSAYHEMPAEGALFVQLGIFRESAEAVVADALRRAEELEPGVVAKGEAVLDTSGPALDPLSKGAAARVVGTRGHRELTGLLLGSVSEYVLHHATCTTIVAR
jgi:nucleotide-binding universal stress UspA family protein